MDVSSPLERATRLAVAFSAAAALIFQAVLGGRASRPLPLLMAIAFVAGFAGGRVSHRGTVFTLLASAFVLPAIWQAWPGAVGPPTQTIWIAALFGLAMAIGGFGAWSLPASWRVVLAVCALAVAMTWPIIALREIDFIPALLNDDRMHVTRIGIAPPVHIVWILYASLVVMVSVLWADALFAEQASHDGRAFERKFLWPCLAGMVASLAVAFIQMFVDMAFLNQNFFAYLKRASGALRDANAFGMLAALWGAAATALALRIEGRWRWLAVLAAIVCSSAGVWGSGSRTALLALACALVGAAIGILRSLPRRAFWPGVAVLAVVTVAAGRVFLSLGDDVGGPVARMFERLDLGGGTAREVVAELWRRGEYGSIATRLIAEHPWSGLGVGSFHALIVDYAFAWKDIGLAPDNAQNWYRHLVAEVGWTIAVFWFWWIGLLLVAVCRTLWSGSPAMAPVAFAIVGFLLGSLFGVPAQQGAVLFSLVTLSAWLYRDRSGGTGRKRVAAGYWVGALAVVLVFVAATAHASWNELRVPARAAETRWPYEYGLYRPEQSAEGGFRWTEHHAVAVFPPGGRYLRLRIQARHPDIERIPVDVRVKMRGQTIIRARLRSREIAEYYVEMPARREFAMLEFLVDRTFTAREGGRELGIIVRDWEFLDEAPENTWIYRSSIAAPPPRNP